MSYFLEATAEYIPWEAVVLFVDVAIKATALLLLAIFANVLLRRRSAAVRHRVWSLTFCGLLCLPLLATLLPSLRLPILPPVAEAVVSPLPTAIGSEPVATSDDQFSGQLEMNPAETEGFSPAPDDDLFRQPPNSPANTSAISLADSASEDVPNARATPIVGSDVRESALSSGTWGFVVYALWSIGFLFTVLPLAMGFIRNAALQNGANTIADAPQLTRLQKLSITLGLRRRVNLLETPRAIVPITWGVLRPIVLFPVAWREWTAERRELVLLHELAHVKRLDVAWQLIARLVCAVYWFHPLSWYALRQLRIERELACDDCVLMTGARPSEYARELVEMARSYQALSLPTAVAMAQTTNLEQRVKALLDRARSHVPVGRMAGRLLLALAILVVTGIAIVRPSAKASGSASSSAVRIAAAEQQAQDSATISTESSEAKALEGPQLVDRKFQAATAVDAASKAVSKIHGCVLGANGRPQEGVSVWVAQQTVPDERWISKWRPTKWRRIAQSAKNGKFEAPLTTRPGSTIRIAATAPGFGWVWKEVEVSKLDDEVSLQLVKDYPIEGQILSLDGKPAVGVRLTVNHMTDQSPDSTLDEILRATVGSSGVYTNSPAPPLNGGGPEFTAVLTDAEGRFRIEGMGANRSVRLEANGGGIGASRFRILTRATPEKLKPHGAVDVREGLPESTYFAKFTHVATPARTIRGTVTDKTTGQPVSGVRISSRLSWSLMLNPVTTDANGRYEITDLPKMEKYRPLIFEPPGTGHFNKEIKLADSPGLQPITLDVTLAKGISVTGKLTDGETGQPLSGTMTYSPLSGNENWRTIGDPDVANPAATSAIGEDGTYEISVLPGPGGLTARTTASGYVPPKIDTKRLREISTDVTENIRGGVSTLSTQAGDQSHGLVGMFDKHALALINPSIDETQLTVNLAAVKGRSLGGTILDEEGQPLAGVKATGLISEVEPGETLETADFTVKDLAPGQKRWLYFQHAERKLGAAVVVEGQPSEPLTVRMQPTGSLKVRFVDKLGEPLPDVEVHLFVGPGLFQHTDADGRVEVPGVIANTEYWIRAKPATLRGPMLHVGKATIAPGQTKDVGTFTRKNKSQYKLVENSAKADSEIPRGNAKAAAMPKNAQNGKTPKTESLGFGGRVLAPDGKPAEGVTVVAGLVKKELSRLEAVTDSNGRFEFHGDRKAFEAAVREQARYQARITVSADGFARDWRLMLTAELPGSDVKMQLREFVPIQGRIVSSEGQPLPNIEVNATEVSRPAGGLGEYIRRAKEDYLSDAATMDNWSMGDQHKVRTDADGRFRFDKFGAERIVKLKLHGDGVADSDIVVVTPSPPEGRKEFGTLATTVTQDSPHYFAEFTHVAPASRTLQGIVVDEKTGTPIPGVEVQCFAAKARATTKADGRFRFTGCLKAAEYQFHIATQTQPYFNRSLKVADTDGAQPVDIEFKLSKGITVKGTLTDGEKPLSGVVSYNVLYPSPHADRIQGTVPSPGYARAIVQPDGSFEIQVLPGPGIITARVRPLTDKDVEYLMPQVAAADLQKILKHGADQRMKDGPQHVSIHAGGRVVSAVGLVNYQALALISPTENDKEVSVALKAELGMNLNGKVVDSGGQAVSRFDVSRLSPRHSGLEPIAGSDFVVRGLGPGRPRRIVFYQPDIGQGTVLDLIGDEEPGTSLNVTLKPCGSLKGQLVDKQGEPVKNGLVVLGRGNYSGNPNTWSGRTNEDGQFKISGLVPGETYNGHLGAQTAKGYIIRGVVVKPGAEVNLGKVAVPSFLMMGKK